MSNRNRNRNGRRRGPPPRGFTGRGWDEFYQVALPIRGPSKRALFNRVSRWAVAGAGLAGSVMGYGAGGVLGAALGLGLSVTGVARYLVKNRFYRR
jgi:hypothetical protein